MSFISGVHQRPKNISEPHRRVQKRYLTIFMNILYASPREISEGIITVLEKYLIQYVRHFESESWTYKSRERVSFILKR